MFDHGVLLMCLQRFIFFILCFEEVDNEFKVARGWIAKSTCV